MIEFQNIPSSIDRPGTYGEFNLSATRAGLPANEDKLLFLAQRIKTPSDWVLSTAYSLGDVVKPTTLNGHYYVAIAAGTSAASEPTWPTTASGTVTDGTVTWLEYIASSGLQAALTSFRVYSADEVAVACGSGSVAHMMAVSAFAANRQVNLSILPIDDDGSAVKASGSIQITAAATSAGVLYFYIGDERIAISITSGDSANTIASALNDAIVEKKHLLPVISYVATDTVTLKAKNGGTLGNYIPLSYTTTAGTVAATVTDMASGATDPDLGAVSGALDSVFDGDYTQYVCSFVDSDNLGDLKSHMDDVSGPTEQRPGLAVFAYTNLVGNIAAVKTLCGTTLNHWRSTCAYLPNSRSIVYQIAAGYAAVIASSTHPTTNLDKLPVKGLHVPEIGSRLSGSEIEDCIDSGVTPLFVSSGYVVIERAVTTYVTNDQGVIDRTRRDIGVPRGLDYARSAYNARLTSKYPRARKTERVKKDVLSECRDVAYSLDAAPAGIEVTDGFASYEDLLTIENDAQNLQRVNIKVPVPLTQGLHVIAVRYDFL